MSGARKVTQAGAVRVTEDVGIEPLPTLRDEFAKAAMTQLMSGHVHPGEAERRRISKEAFAWADEMLAAREIPPDQLRDLVRR